MWLRHRAGTQPLALRCLLTSVHLQAGAVGCWGSWPWAWQEEDWEGHTRGMTGQCVQNLLFLTLSGVLQLRVGSVGWKHASLPHPLCPPPSLLTKGFRPRVRQSDTMEIRKVKRGSPALASPEASFLPFLSRQGRLSWNRA